MNTELVSIKRFFDNLSVPLSNIWLESCIAWCKKENLPSNYTMKDLQNTVYGQWLLLDLRDVEVPVLPPDLSNTTHRIINGNYCLQLMKIVDISKPKLWQLQNIRNSNALTKSIQKESDDVGNSKRMLMLTLTDGIQEVEAMEYSSVSCINVNITPGCKIRLLGPVTVRRGRIMLEERHLKVLGGEVEELLIPNAAENVLAAALNLGLNPNPTQINTTLLNPVLVEEPQNNERVTQRHQNAIINGNRPVQRTANTRQTVDYEERRIEQSIKNPQSINDQNKPKSPDIFGDDEFNDEDFKQLDQIANGSGVNQAFEDDGDDDVFAQIDIDAHLGQIGQKKPEPASSPKLVNPMPISKLLERQPFVGRGIFKIKARLRGIVEKFTIDNDEYKLVIKVGDDSGEIVTKVHSDVISEFLGYHPTVLASLRDIVREDQSAIEKVKQALKNVKDRLQALNNVMDVLIIKNEIATITKIF